MDRDSVPDPSHGWDHHTLARGLRAALFVVSFFCLFVFILFSRLFPSCLIVVVSPPRLVTKSTGIWGVLKFKSKFKF